MIVKPPPKHKEAFTWLKRANTKDIEMIVSSHTPAELYHVLTKFPVKPAFSPGVVKQIIYKDIKKAAKFVSLSPEEYLEVIGWAADYGMTGGIIFDAIIAHVAVKMNVEKLLTYNVKDFIKLMPGKEYVVVSPYDSLNALPYPLFFSR